MPNGSYANGPDSSRTGRETPFTLREWFVWRCMRRHLALLAVAILPHYQATNATLQAFSLEQYRNMLQFANRG